MSKEIRNILAAYNAACNNNRQTALATVVQVEGSSYRRPGARMLVEEDGKITGVISGGCLEGDALRRALQVIHLKEKRLVTYDTSGEDDIEFGVQLGCNGIVHILFEPVDPSNPLNPVLLLKRCMDCEAEAVLVTLFSLQNPMSQEVGTCMFLGSTEQVMKESAFKDALLVAVQDVFQQHRSVRIDFSNMSLTAFVELVKPPVSLVVAGAGNDALPLVDMALMLGWEVTLVDGRSSHANLKRFPGVHKIVVGKPADIMPQLRFRENTAVIIMTHNFNYDLDFMQELSAVSPGYIGCLGPKKRLDRIYEALETRGILLNDAWNEKVYGPAGLDIGAEVSEEIALAILAEIRAVFEKRDGGFLRNRKAPIHINTTATTDVKTDNA